MDYCSSFYGFKLIEQLFSETLQSLWGGEAELVRLTLCFRVREECSGEGFI